MDTGCLDPFRLHISDLAPTDIALCMRRSLILTDVSAARYTFLCSRILFALLRVVPTVCLKIET